MIASDSGLTTAAPTRGADLDLVADLAAIAASLRERWAAALESSRFDEVDGLVEASHAVHRALAALDQRQMVGTARPPEVLLRVPPR
jgi:hypothetical protein